MYHFLNGPKKLTKGMKISLSRDDEILGFILDLRVPSIFLLLSFLRTMAIKRLLLDL